MLKKCMQPGIHKWCGDVGVSLGHVKNKEMFEKYIDEKNKRLASLHRDIKKCAQLNDLDMEAKSYATALLFQKAHEMMLDILGYLSPTHIEITHYKSLLDGVQKLIDYVSSMHLAFSAENGAAYANHIDGQPNDKVN